jgi:ATP-dependent DNA helicase RecG
MSKLPINLDDLLRQRTVEGDRIEYKRGWNPVPVLKTLCAFANDFENLGGGYIVIGQDCDSQGLPVFPPAGLTEAEIEHVQQELHRYCQKIEPHYFPILSVEEYASRKLVVLWAPGGQNRPYDVPRDVTAPQSPRHYYIRRYASTVEAQGEEERELLSLTATIPFDDRRCQHATVEDLRLPLIQNYLREVGSQLADEAPRLPLAELGRRLNIVDGGEEFLRPRNIGVLFFHERPAKFLPGAQIDVVIFPRGPGGGELIEKSFDGPLHEQVRESLRYLQSSVIRERVVKHPNRPESERVANYPFAALEEAVVNAVYHRSYEQREPVEVRVNPQGIEIVSYPGPDPSIRLEALNAGNVVARRYRNRRIGDFLKELDLTEGRSTGIPTILAAMQENGSPPPRFSTDDHRTHFLVELPIHPAMPGVPEAHDEAHDEAHEPLTDTERQILAFLAPGPVSRPDVADSLGLKSRSGHLYKAISRLRELGLLELTVPDKPQSKNQRLKLTAKGQTRLAELTNTKGSS